MIAARHALGAPPAKSAYASASGAPIAHATRRASKRAANAYTSSSTRSSAATHKPARIATCNPDTANTCSKPGGAHVGLVFLRNRRVVAEHERTRDPRRRLGQRRIEPRAHVHARAIDPRRKPRHIDHAHRARVLHQRLTLHLEMRGRARMRRQIPERRARRDLGDELHARGERQRRRSGAQARAARDRSAVLESRALEHADHRLRLAIETGARVLDDCRAHAPRPTAESHRVSVGAGGPVLAPAANTTPCNASATVRRDAALRAPASSPTAPRAPRRRTRASASGACQAPAARPCAASSPATQLAPSQPSAARPIPHGVRTRAPGVPRCSPEEFQWF